MVWRFVCNAWVLRIQSIQQAPCLVHEHSWRFQSAAERWLMATYADSWFPPLQVISFCCMLACTGIELLQVLSATVDANSKYRSVTGICLNPTVIRKAAHFLNNPMKTCWLMAEFHLQAARALRFWAGDISEAAGWLLKDRQDAEVCS